MDTIITKLIAELNPSIVVLFIVLASIMFLLWKVSAFIATWQLKHAEHENKLNSTADVKEKVIALETNIGKAVEFGERIVRIETKLDLIYQKISPNPFAQSQSPMALTSEGVKISEKINAADTVNSSRELGIIRR